MRMKLIGLVFLMIDLSSAFAQGTQSICSIFLENQRSFSLSTEIENTKSIIVSATEKEIDRRLNQLPLNIRRRVEGVLNSPILLDESELLPAGLSTLRNAGAAVLWNSVEKRIQGFYINKKKIKSARSLLYIVHELDHIIEFAKLEIKLDNIFYRWRSSYMPSKKEFYEYEKRAYSAEWNFYESLRSSESGLSYEEIVRLFVMESTVPNSEKEKYITHLLEARLVGENSISIASEVNRYENMSYIAALELWPLTDYVRARLNAHKF
jgi:hypothetical protein